MTDSTTITEVTMYKTEDGQVFDTKQEAEQHVSKVELIEKLEADFYGCIPTIGSMAHWIISNLNFTFR